MLPTRGVCTSSLAGAIVAACLSGLVVAAAVAVAVVWRVRRRQAARAQPVAQDDDSMGDAFMPGRMRPMKPRAQGVGRVSA